NPGAEASTRVSTSAWGASHALAWRSRTAPLPWAPPSPAWIARMRGRVMSTPAPLLLEQVRERVVGELLGGRGLGAATATAAALGARRPALGAAGASSARGTTLAARARAARGVAHARGQRDALPRHVHLEHLHRQPIADLHGLARILDEALGELADVHQA